MAHTKVLFRCDAGHAPEIGTGHIMRATCLAEALINSGLSLQREELLFLTRDDPEFHLGGQYLASSGFPHRALGENQLEANSVSELQTIVGVKPDLVIMDRLQTTKAFIEGLKSRGLLVVTFDDYGSGRSEADLAISSIFSDVEQTKNLLSGYSYLVLSRSHYVPLELRETVKNIVATFGGHDARNLGQFLVENLDKLPEACHLKIILGAPNDEFIQATDKLKSGAGQTIEVLIRPSDFHDHIANADLGLTSGGLSIFEFAAWGVPTVSIPQYEHQLDTIERLQIAGVSVLGSNGMELSNERFGSAVNDIVSVPEVRLAMARNATAVVDGRGLQRILDALKSKFVDVLHA